MAKPNLFNSIALKRPNKNVFDLSHDVKMSLDMGELCPILAMECVPGDKVSLSCESLLRFAPLIAPVMHRMDVSMHYFFVPNRIIWDGWEKWITDQASVATVPYINIDGDNPSTYTKLHDYLGVPPLPSGTGIGVSALPFAAYQMIYNEYYRDQNLVNEVNFKLTNGDNSSNADLTVLRLRAWMHDYFTASLPFAQKGNAVDIPFGIDDSPVKFNIAPGTGSTNNVISATHNGSADDILVERELSENTDIDTTLYADNSDVTGNATINDLRRAFRLQEWLEKNARAGTRYVENILAHFGVKSSDARLQRPEYITGTKSPVVVSEVLNTTGTDDLPQGNMAGHGLSVTSGKYGSYFCEEHGYIIGIMSVMPLTAYQQGIPKHFLKTKDQFQFYWPAFANIGEQEVFNAELYLGVDSASDEVFGYVPRYAEYKYMQSRVAGDFRDSLDFWHLGRIFASKPSLNQAFVECTPGKRIFAVEGAENSLYAHVLNKIRAVRPMPKFGTPSF